MIIGLGCVSFDQVLATDTTWDAGKGRIIRREERFGGNVRNSLGTVAAFDYPGAYVATLGTSPLSDHAMADLVDHNIQTTFVERRDGADPVVSTLTITADGERYIAFDDSSWATTPLPSESVIAAALAVADVLLVDAPTAPPGTVEVVQRARAAGIPVVLDAERDSVPAVRELMAIVDHLVIPLGFGIEVTGQRDPAKVAAELWTNDRAAVVLTDGVNGAYALQGSGELLHVPALPITAVDTTGCGDAFHGGYAWSLHRGDDMETRMQIATAAAAVLAALPAGAPRVASRSAAAALIPNVDLG